MSYTLENLKKEQKSHNTAPHSQRNYVVRHELQYHTVYRMFIFSADFQVFLRTSK